MDMRLYNIAQDWANALAKYKRPSEMQIVADETGWGFGEVLKGKRPDAVLKDVLRRIEDKVHGKGGRKDAGQNPPPANIGPAKDNSGAGGDGV